MNGDESHWPSCPFPLIDVDREGLRGEGKEKKRRNEYGFSTLPRQRD